MECNVSGSHGGIGPKNTVMTSRRRDDAAVIAAAVGDMDPTLGDAGERCTTDPRALRLLM